MGMSCSGPGARAPVRFRAGRPAVRRRFPACDRGVTLVEALVAALLLALVMVAVLGLYGRAVVYLQRAQTAADLEDHVRVSLNTLGSDLRNARTLNWLAGPPARIQPNTAADLLELAVPRRATPWETERIRYSWAPTGTGDTRNVLRRQVGSAVPQPVAHHIVDIEIDLETGNGLGDRGLVLVTLRAERDYGGRPVAAQAAGSFQMRVMD